MAESLDLMKRHRAAMRGTTTKLVKKIEQILEEEPDDFKKIEECLAQLKRKEKELPLLDNDIWKALKPEELEQEVESSEEYKDNVTTWITRLESHLKNKDKREERTRSGSESSTNGNTQLFNSFSNKKLPRLSIVTFNGDCANWQTFWAQFSSAIDTNEDLSKVDKFNYLFSYLGGPAAKAIAGLTLTEKNYDAAIKILTDRFGRKDLIISAHMHNLLNVTPVKSSSDIHALRNVYDNCEIQIRSLESLGILSDTYGSLLSPILLKNLPKDIVIEFNRQRDHDAEWNVSELLKLLRREVESRERAELLIRSGDSSNSSSKEKSVKNGKSDNEKQWKAKKNNFASAAALNTTTETKCLFCPNADHLIENCGRTLKERKDAVRKDNRCFVCLKRFHKAQFCRSREKCKECNRRHHTSLCDRKTEVKPPNTSTTMVGSISQQTQGRTFVCLQTVKAVAKGENSKEVIRCLLDGGSQRTFIQQDISRKLRLPVVGTESLTIQVFGNDKPTQVISQRVKVVLETMKDPKETITLEALETPVITSAVVPVPNHTIQETLKREGLEFSDNNFVLSPNQQSNLSLLIGSDFYWTIATGKIKRLGNNLVAMETKLGWSLHGPVPVIAMTEFSNATKVMKLMVESEDELVSSQLRKYWELDSLGIERQCDLESRDNDETMKIFESSVKRVGNRYQVSLPWKPNTKELLGDNYCVAEARLKTLVKKFRRDPLFFTQYKEVIHDYAEQGIIETVDLEKRDSQEAHYYLPHRAVLRHDRSTTKLRIVFDASSHEANKLSLNECLFSGPNLNPDLFDILLKFRSHKIAFTADIEKAFLQIELTPDDRDVARFLWTENPYQDELLNIQCYRLTRVLFGVTSSPFLLAATVKHHLKEFAEPYPETVDLLNNSLYVDDLIGGAETESEAFQLSRESTEILNSAGMVLRKWQTNSEKLREMWKSVDVNNELPVKIISDVENDSKVLGLAWNSEGDYFYFNTDDLLSFLRKRLDTKRFVLQTSGRIFDPLGLLTPYTIRIKCIFQKLWIKGLKWDDQLPPDVKEKWEDWCEELPQLRSVKIPRCFLSGSCRFVNIQIHCFTDASEKAYGAVLYARCTNTDGTIETNLICSKSRVAPIKKLSLPRLELMGALIGARIVDRVKSCLNIQASFYYWSDSQITMHWIKGQAHRYKPFVQNRTAEIHTLCDPSEWAHCPGITNPADILSRGQTIFNLKRSSLWWKGPEWLSKTEENWPTGQKERMEVETDEQELRKEYKDVMQASCAVSETLYPIFNLEDFSSYLKVIRVTAWILRFRNNIDKKNQNKTKTGFLTADELNTGEEFWIRHVQGIVYKREVNDLQAGREIDADSKIKSLKPFFDSKGIMRVGGRIEFAELTFDEKHPILLPRESKLTELIIESKHKKAMHCGVAYTLCEIRKKFWIPQGRQAVKKIIRNCLICKKLSAKPCVEIAAPLPKERITETPPFETVGVDFAGPLYVKVEKGKTTSKVYIALFSCAVTRAIHLELVSNQTADTFLLALKRFISRRGNCRIIYSDNSKTFKRTEKELSTILKVCEEENVQDFVSTQGIVWNFIAEKSPWWGGFYERLVRSVKTCLRKVLGKASLTFEELVTVLAEVESTINSRPLTYVYNELDEPEPLTPAHFLTGKMTARLPTESLSKVSELSTKEELTKRRKYREEIIKRLWQKWKNEYLKDLRTAHHCSNPGKLKTIEVNDIVLIHDEKKPKAFWKMGLVKEIYPGRDGKIRSCSVKIEGGGILRRSVQLLYPLELC